MPICNRFPVPFSRTTLHSFASIFPITEGGYSNCVLRFVFKCSLSQSWRKFRRNGYICISKTSSGTAWWSPGGYSRAASMTSVNIHCFFYSLLFLFDILTLLLSGFYSDLPQQLGSNHPRSWPHHVSSNCLNHKHFHGMFFSCFCYLWLLSLL